MIKKFFLWDLVERWIYSNFEEWMKRKFPKPWVSLSFDRPRSRISNFPSEKYENSSRPHHLPHLIYLFKN
jgi:hypothetical protein